MNRKEIVIKTEESTITKDLEISSVKVLNDWGILSTSWGEWPFYKLSPMQYGVWWLYYVEGWSIVDLCECFPPYGFHADEIRNAKSCKDLQKKASNAKNNWNEHVETWGKIGSIFNELDVISYLANPIFDTPCQTMAFSGCTYWTSIDEMRKRGCPTEE